MMDLSATIIAKSDQLNADDLISGPLTVTVESISATGDPKQPIMIGYGVPGKTYKPCLTMRRMLIAAWGKDGHAWVGRRMTLFRDPIVSWGGKEVGGIVVSHASGITDAVMRVLAVSNKKKRAFTILPLVEVAPPTLQQVADHVGVDIVNAYLQQTGWLTDGQTYNELTAERQNAIIANPQGFATAATNAAQSAQTTEQEAE